MANIREVTEERTGLLCFLRGKTASSLLAVTVWTPATAEGTSATRPHQAATTKETTHRPVVADSSLSSVRHTPQFCLMKKMMIYFINPTRGNSGFHMKRASERTDLESSFKNDLSWASCSPPASWHQLKCKWRFWGCTAQIMLGPAHHDDHPASPVKDADTLASSGCISISHTGFLLLVTSAFVDLNWWRSQSLSGCYKMFLYNREYIHGGRVIVASPEHFSLLKSERSLNAAFQMLVLCVFIFVCCGLRGVNSLNSSWGRGGCLCLSLAEGFVGE